jgi:hypothetical protein
MSETAILPSTRGPAATRSCGAPSNASLPGIPTDEKTALFSGAATKAYRLTL